MWNNTNLKRIWCSSCLICCIFWRASKHQLSKKGATQLYSDSWLTFLGSNWMALHDFTFNQVNLTIGVFYTYWVKLIQIWASLHRKQVWVRTSRKQGEIQLVVALLHPDLTEASVIERDEMTWFEPASRDSHTWALDCIQDYVSIAEAL